MIKYDRAFRTGTRSHFETGKLFRIEADINSCFLNKDYSLRVTKGILKK